jgi:hypothetical protein
LQSQHEWIQIRGHESDVVTLVLSPPLYLCMWKKILISVNYVYIYIYPGIHTFLIGRNLCRNFYLGYSCESVYNTRQLLHAINTNIYIVYRRITQLHISATYCKNQRTSVIYFHTCILYLLLVLLLFIIKINVSKVYEFQLMHKLQTHVTVRYFTTAKWFGTSVPCLYVCIDLVIYTGCPR